VIFYEWSLVQAFAITKIKLAALHCQSLVSQLKLKHNTFQSNEIFGKNNQFKLFLWKSGLAGRNTFENKF